MSEQTPEQVEGTEGTEVEPKEAKKSSLELLQEAYPEGTRVVFEKTDDKGKAGAVTGHVEKYGVGYLEVLVELSTGKTKTVNTRDSSVRVETQEDVDAREAAAKAKADEAAKKAAEKAAAEQKAKNDAELSASAKALEAEEAEVTANGGADEEVAKPTSRRRNRK
jgi:hypothetical protein